MYGINLSCKEGADGSRRGVTMAATVESYYNITEKAPRLRAFYDKYGEEALFIVPSGLDREALLDTICGGAAYFGGRPQVWTVGDL